MWKLVTLFGLAIGLAIGGCMTQHEAQQRATGIWRPASTDDAVVRYQIADLDRGIEFYTSQLGFRLERRAGPIAVVARGALHLLLSGPESSGSRPLADGQSQQPGGWNRIVLYVDDIAAEVDVCAARVRGSSTRSRSARAASRSRSPIRTAIRSSCTKRRLRVNDRARRPRAGMRTTPGSARPRAPGVNPAAGR